MSGGSVGSVAQQKLEPLVNQALCFFPEDLAAGASKDRDNNCFVIPLSNADETMAGGLREAGLSSHEVFVRPEELIRVGEKEGFSFFGRK